MIDKPEFIHRDGMTADAEYIKWLADVKSRFTSAQAKAMVKVNSELLRFYWSIGRDLVAMHPEDKWGKGIVRQFALDMRNAFPNETGFSDTNVKYMRQWYEFYYNKIISQQPVGQIPNEIGQQPGGQFEMPQKFGLVPWGHHIKIISMCQSIQEAVFYINKTIEGNWSRSMLEDNIAGGLYSRQGTAITNFSDRLPSPQGNLAQEILKDPYNFDFLTMRKGYDEKELEDALVNNITRFLLEMGQAFDACTEGRLLQISPWEYHMDRKLVTRQQCLELNAMAEYIAK